MSSIKDFYLALQYRPETTDSRVIFPFNLEKKIFCLDEFSEERTKGLLKYNEVV